MKRTLSSIMATVAVAIVCAEGSFGQETGSYPSLLAASEIKGTKVKNLQNHDIGDIHELPIEPTITTICETVEVVCGSAACTAAEAQPLQMLFLRLTLYRSFTSATNFIRLAPDQSVTEIWRSVDSLQALSQCAESHSSEDLCPIINAVLLLMSRQSVMISNGGK